MTIARRLAAVLLLGALLAGCGGAQAPPGTPVPSAPAPNSEAPAPPPTTDVALPWPEGSPDGVAALQERVDGGSQPWLLDPAEVALSFAAAAYGWTAAEAEPRDGGTVDVRGPDGAAAALTLEQPGRTGPTGIWVVTAADRS
jgi:hypothetical protein